MFDDAVHQLIFGTCQSWKMFGKLSNCQASYGVKIVAFAHLLYTFSSFWIKPLGYLSMLMRIPRIGAVIKIKLHHSIQVSHFGRKTITLIVHASSCTDSSLLKWPLPSGGGGYDSCWLIDATIRGRIAGEDCRLRTRRRKRGDWKQKGQITHLYNLNTSI